MQPGDGGCVVSVRVVQLPQHVWGMDALLWHFGDHQSLETFFFFPPSVNFTQKVMALLGHG